MKLAMIWGAVCAAGVAASAAAQLNTLHNGSFEVIDPGNPGLPEGWGKFNTARYRRVGDGLGPLLVRTGDASIELPGGVDFAGFTTNVFDPNTFELYDPPYVFGGGKVTVRGWYAIPADQPIAGGNAGLKIEFRRVPPNFSVYWSKESLTISGHTNGQWREMVVTVDCAEIPVFPELPGSASVLPIRFGQPNQTGTIFWDDLEFIQCIADFECDGSLDVFDFLGFQNAYAQNDRRACNLDASTGPDLCDIFDFLAYQNLFAMGCP